MLADQTSEISRADGGTDDCSVEEIEETSSHKNHEPTDEDNVHRLDRSENSNSHADLETFRVKKNAGFSQLYSAKANIKSISRGRPPLQYHSMTADRLAVKFRGRSSSSHQASQDYHVSVRG